VVAKGIAQQLPPVTIAFLRWGTASLIMLPLGWKHFQRDKHIIFKNKAYFFWVSLTGVALFNTFIYLAGHYTSAINLALIGTTAAPVFATILAGIFLKEAISSLRVTGMLCCFAGVLYLLCNGSWLQLLHLHFAKGDLLMLVSASAFAVYNTLVKKKPQGIHAMSFLLASFVTGSLLMLPFFIAEQWQTPTTHFSLGTASIILYLGLGNSVIGFLCWNASIAKIGASRTVIFANLIPIFSTIEAVLLLNETFTITHLVAGSIIVSGLIIANLKR
jgi:drug/metabolite transporter (DMT)-like permease